MAKGFGPFQVIISIYTFTGATSWRAHDWAENESDNLRRAIPACVREIHAYLGIDDDTIWSIIQDDVPELLKQLNRLRTAE